MSNSDTNNILQLPNPAHIQADSMLARRFGKETVNYFGGTFTFFSFSEAEIL
jgi:NAD+ diphosphatase